MVATRAADRKGVRLKVVIVVVVIKVIASSFAASATFIEGEARLRASKLSAADLAVLAATTFLYGMLACVSMECLEAAEA